MGDGDELIEIIENYQDLYKDLLYLIEKELKLQKISNKLDQDKAFLIHSLGLLDT